MALETPVSPPSIARLVRALSNARGHDERKPLRAALRQASLARGPALARHLDDVDALTRWEVVNLLGELRDPRVAATVVRFALGEDEVHARWRAFWAVSRFDRGVTVPLLLEALRGDDPAPAWRAALMLTLLRQPAAVPTLIAGLSSGEEWIRWEALSGLKALAPACALPAILPFLEPGHPRSLRQEAVLAVGAIGTAVGRKALEGLLGDDDPQIRWRASMGLGRIGDPGSVDPLRTRLGAESDPGTRRQLMADLKRLETHDARTPAP